MAKNGEKKKKSGKGILIVLVLLAVLGIGIWLAADKFPVWISRSLSGFMAGEYIEYEEVVYAKTGKTVSLSQSISADGASYYSEDEKIATVDEKGLITVVRPGVTFVHAVSTVDGVIKDRRIIVDASSKEDLNIELDASCDFLSMKEKANVKLTVTDSYGRDISDRVGKIIYGSKIETKETASLTRKGDFYIQNPGKAYVSAIIEVNGTYFFEEFPVQVLEEEPENAGLSVSVEGDSTRLSVGETKSLKVVVKDQNGKIVTDKATIIYAVKDDGIATVDNGKVTGVDHGETNAHIRAEYDGKVGYTDYVITVGNGGIAARNFVIVVDTDSTDITEGKSKTLQYSIFTKSGVDVTDVMPHNVVVSDESIAAISGKKITGIAEGVTKGIIELKLPNTSEVSSRCEFAVVISKAPTKEVATVKDDNKETEEDSKSNETGHSHSYIIESKTSATCNTDGVIVYQCVGCGKIMEEVQPKTGAHKYVVINRVESTCSEVGYEAVKCSECGYEEMKDLPLLNHTYLEKPIEIVEPDCEKAGREVWVCTECDYNDVRELPATGHHIIIYDDIQPGCDTEGYRYSMCDMCGGANSVVTVPTLSHDYVAEIVVDASCTEYGLITYTCNRCGESYEDEIPSTGAHSWVLIQSDIGGHMYSCQNCSETLSGGHDSDPCSVCGFSSGTP